MGGGAQLCISSKMAQKTQVVEPGRRALREREEGGGRRDKREQEVDGKVIAVSTWSVA